jgi:hypothetical protein
VQEKLTTIKLSTPGKHNIYNALAVVSALNEADVDIEKVKPHFETFSGMGRRFQKVTEFDGIKEFATEQNITITDGDEDMEWRGPDYGEIHVRLTGKMTAHKLYCTIDMILNKQSVNIVFGKKNLTGIEDMTDESGELKVIYDLTGRRIDTITSPGIYIVNGKKVVFM